MGVLVRSDSIANLTPAGREAMVAYGITTVIDLHAESPPRVRCGPPFSNPCAPSPTSTTVAA